MAKAEKDRGQKPPPAGVSSPSIRRPARAELIWDGKYDANGKRVAPIRVALPFQAVETVNESAQDRQKGFQFGSGFYIDPPFDTGANFSFTATVPEEPDGNKGDEFTFTKEPSIIEHKAYRDIWGRGIESYLQWFYEASIMLHELLHENGSIYVHLEPDIGNLVRAVLDEVFGAQSRRTEICWKRTSSHGNVSKTFGEIWESIFFYTKSEDWTWNQQYVPFDESYIESHFTGRDPDGRRWTTSDLVNPGYRPNLSYEYKGYKPHKNGWKFTKDRMEELDRQGRLYFPTNKDGRIRLKRYLDETPGQIAQNLWTDISPINSQAHEALGYATQKPERLLERIISSSSNPGDLVLDCFCGSGTTPAVAEKLGRRWIACDLGRFAVHTTRKRLLSVPDVRPFTVQNLGKYERQAWAGAEFGENEAAERQRAYVEFILKLAQAAPLNGYTWLHGVKGGRMIHVGAVDAPVSVGDVTQIAAEFKRAIGTGKDAPKTNGVDVLGWDFAFEMNEVAKQQAAAANIQMRFLRIPRDVMDKRAVEQGDIKFFELAALSVDVKINKRNVSLKLKDFVIPPDDVPEEARKAVKHWSQWIDYWAVDWDNRSDTFHNEWQAYRTRKGPSLQLEITHAYADPGEYTVVVKVIDILGNDTTKTVKVKVA